MISLRCIFTGFAFLFFAVLLAQDIQFSQFNAAPLNLNPALTGVMNGDLRVNLNGRSQWVSTLRGDAYKTAAVSLDARRQLENGDYLGYGIIGNLDRSGELSYGTTQGNGSFSYHKRIGQDSTKINFLVTGLAVGVIKRKIDIRNPRWSSQYSLRGADDPYLDSFGNVGGYKPDMLHGELSLGMLWSSVLAYHTSYYLGIAGHHLNQSQVSFYDSIPNSKFYIRKTIHGGGEYPLSDKVSLLASFAYVAQGAHKQSSFGAEIKKYWGSPTKESSIQFGIYSRISNQVDAAIHSDGLMLSARYDICDIINIGISIDSSTSDTRVSGYYNGAFELSLGYLFNSNKLRPKIMPSI